MADSSSDSDFCLRTRRRGPLRATHEPRRSRAAEQVSDKIHQLASTLQDTSRNLQQVDEMLGEYRGYNSDQTGAIASLKESLEQSIDHLRSQRLARLSGGRSASLSSLCPGDLDTTAGTRRLQPTSPLKDYTDLGAQRRRRSRSAGVRFLDEAGDPDQIHSLHQSLRDLSSDQLRLNDELSRELARRNRTDAETKRALKELTVRCGEAQRQETVSERVERRLQQLEQELKTERQQQHLLLPRGQVSPQLQEALKKQDGKTQEAETSLKETLGRVEREKSQLKEELERYRRRLDQTEGSRDTLLCQVEDLRSQLLKLEEDRGHLQHQVSQISLQSQHESRDEERRIRAAVERSEQGKQELERQIAELRTQVDRNAIMSEIGDLKRSLEVKDREKGQLTAHLEALSTDMEKREEQQRKMLEQLKEIQGRYETCERERRQLESHNAELLQQLEEVTQEAERCLGEVRQAQALRQEADKRREDVKAKAQETLRHWRLRCKKLEREMEKRAEAESQAAERCAQATKEKEEVRGQLQVTAQQAESLRQELGEALSKRAQQEEELHQRQARLTEAHDQQGELERELRESQELAERLQGELQRQVAIQTQLQEDRDRLQEDLASAGRAQDQSNERLLELQEAVRDLSAERAKLSGRLAQEERSGRELQRSLCEAQKQAEFAREELSSAGRQLKMERDVHQRELSDLRSAVQTARTKHERNVQEMLAHFRQERTELEGYIHTLKAELIDGKSLAAAERQRVEKMKVECDKLSDEALQEREAAAMWRCKQQQAAQDAEEKDQQRSSLAQTLRKLEEANQTLREKLDAAETEQETILSAIDAAVTAAWQPLSTDKLKAVSTAAHLKTDPHYWLAETKTRLLWLCEEMKEREERERKLRRQLQQVREEQKEEKGKREALSLHLSQLERDRKDLLEKNRRRDEEMYLLQDRIVDLERSTRMALDHLESVPEKLSLLNDVKDLNDSHLQREVMEERYTQYREIVSSLQQQLEDSKSRIQEYREEKLKADVQSARLTALSSIRTTDSFLSSSLRSDSNSPGKRGRSPSFEGLKDLKTSVRLSEMAS